MKKTLIAFLLATLSASSTVMASSLPIPLDPETAAKAVSTSLQAAKSKPPVIDLLVIHSSKVSSDRITEIVNITNKALADSKANVSVNKMCETVDDNWANVQPSVGLYRLISSAESKAKLARLIRNACKADLVVYVAPLRAEDNVCGVSRVNLKFNPRLGYMVVRDGIGGGYYCPGTTLAHEFGHQLGADHDRAHASHNMVDGYTAVAYPFSFGYGVDGVFGDIMSYIGPQVPLYSSPNINCVENTPCGTVDDDAVRTFNLTARRVSKYK